MQFWTKSRTGMLFAVFVCARLIPPAAHAADSASGSTVDFNREIRPIFSEFCYPCHGPDKHGRKADFRLDVEEGVFEDRGGYQAIVRGKSDESELFVRLASDSPNEIMPPPKFHKRPSRQQIELVRRWIDQGAVWQKHWSYNSVERPKLPTVGKVGWARNAIDHFILAALESEQLMPATAADKLVLLRRVTFDLTGLPPTPDAARAYLNDTSADAYERVVDRLLASPQHGEHMARFWLDAARYGDTHGLHLDNYREMWPYRDWVIQAFNAAMPFDQFTVEQLAGDLLPKATIDQQIASGFNRCHVSTNEGGVIEEEVYVRNVIDRVETTGTVFLGLTLGCAVCHEHKYDPVTQQEFYRLFAFFNNMDGTELDGNRKDHAPVIKVPSVEQTRRLAEFDVQIAKLDAALRAPMPKVDADQLDWEAQQRQRAAKATPWTVLDPAQFRSLGGASLKKLDDKSILASGTNPDKDTYELIAPVSLRSVQAIRLEGLTHDSLMHTAGRSANGNAVLTELEWDAAPADKPTAFTPVKISRAWADHEQGDGDFKIANAIDGKSDTGWAIAGHQLRENRTAIFAAEKPIAFDPGAVVRVRLKHESIFAKHHFGRVRLSVAQSDDIPQFGHKVALSDWHSLGPFNDVRAEHAYRHNFGPEGNPVDLKTAIKAGNEVLHWTRRPHWTDGKVHYDLAGEICATYLYRTIESSGAQRVTLNIGSDDAVKVWVNRKEVLARNQMRVAAADQEKIDVQLKAGVNEILLKVVNFAGGHGFYFALKAEGITIPSDILTIVSIESAKRSVEQSAQLRDFYRNSVAQDQQLKSMQDELASSRKQRTDLTDQVPTTQVMRDAGSTKDAFILIRGQYDKKGEKVARATPSVLPPLPKHAPRNRLGLASWLTDRRHPLTARVTVNRFWQQYFGTGLVKTAEDFGSQGELPSHPELLEWLAAEFMESGWNTKRMQRLIVTSSTYRQSSKVAPDLLSKDPANRLLARGPRFRLDAEMLRDQALAASGLLVWKMGGPSVKPPQPEGLWEAVGYSGSNTVKFVADSGEKVYRRSVYSFWKRTAPPPQMTTFDAPSREACTVRRERTNTPLQALLLMNERQSLDAARALAEQALKVVAAAPRDRARFLFRQVTCREPSDRSLSELVSAYADLASEFRRHPAKATELIAVGNGAKPRGQTDPIELAAWTMIGNIVLNLDEVLTKE